MSRETEMVVIARKIDGTADIWCDPEIADLVTALNAGGIRTVASCSGHGHRPGFISLADGRWLILPRDEADIQRIDSIFPDINGSAPMTETSDWYERRYEDAIETALSASPKGDDLEPVAYIVHDPMAGEPEVSFIRTIGLENEPLYPASALQSLKAERDALASQVQRMEYSDGDAEHWKFLAERAEAENATLKREIAELREANMLAAIGSPQ